MPTARPVKKADAPKDSAYVLMTGSWVNRSKNEKNIIKYINFFIVPPTGNYVFGDI